MEGGGGTVVVGRAGAVGDGAAVEAGAVGGGFEELVLGAEFGQEGLADLADGGGVAGGFDAVDGVVGGVDGPGGGAGDVFVVAGGVGDEPGGGFDGGGGVEGRYS